MTACSLASRAAGLILVFSLVAVAGGEAFDHLAPLAPPGLPFQEEVEASRAELRLRFAWYDVSGAVPGAFGVTRAEASRLLGRMGIRSEWRRGRTGEGGAPEEIRVIVLNRPGRRAGASRSTMGAVQRGGVAPSLWVYLPSVITALGWSPAAIGPGSALGRRRELGLALGRVVAHEIVHLLAPQLPHAGGLMSSSLNRKQLLAAEIPIDAEVLAAVPATLRAETGGAPPPQTLLATGEMEHRD
jgi:hypothetical protein